MSASASRAEMLQQLRSRLHQPPGAHSQGPERISTGIAPLDGLLPQGGLARGMLIEWLADGEGTGAETLAFLVAATLCRLPHEERPDRQGQSGPSGRGRACVVLDPLREFYPPAAAALGFDLEQMIVLRPRTPGDAFWALEQTLRCAGVGVAIGRLARGDNRGVRRLQLAVESSGAIGFLLRPAEVRALASWANVRLLVTPLPSGQGSSTPSGRRVRVEVIRCRKGTGGGAVDLEISHETGLVSPVPRLAPAAPARRATGT